MTYKGKILVVDDDRLVLATLVHGLSEAGYEVIDADNGDEAILQARAHRPQLALLDIRMEGKTGFDVAAYLREYHQIPFMFLSAFADEETLRQVKALGAVNYLIKPLDIRQIVPAVDAAFERMGAAPEASSNRVMGAAAGQGGHSQADAPVVALGEDPLLQPVAMAIGVLMHRYSLPRQAALQRLTRLAAANNESLKDQAIRLLDAVELLSRPGAEDL